MPRAPLHALTWSKERNRYELFSHHQLVQHFKSEDDSAWLAWLEAATSFAFRGACGRLNVYREQRRRGGSYWYAYAAHTGLRRTVKHYLGRTEGVSLARLEEVARQLAGESALVMFASAQVPGKPDVDFFQHDQIAEHALCLSARLAPPRLPNSLIVRERLLAQMEAVFNRPLTLLSAAAGWGKTTLLSSWAACHPQQVAWLSLEELDSTPSAFWSAVIAALRRQGAHLPRLETTVQRMLRSPESLSMPPILTALITDLREHTQDLTIILDDYHLIEEPRIHEALRFLLEHKSVGLHLVLSSRVDPPLPLARLRVQGAMLEIRDKDLRFTREEVHRFLIQGMGLELSAKDIEALEMRTEGWIASLYLAALSLQKQDTPSAFIQALSGGQRFLWEYLHEEIFDHQPPPVQDFLLQTSWLDRLNASLCDAVTGRNDSARLLQQIEHANLFLQPLEEHESWYRYHALWSSGMQREARRRLGEGAVQQLLMRASRWYETQGLLHDAVETALRARDFSSAAALMERVCQPQSFRKSYLLLRRWLEQLPEALLDQHPCLCFAFAEALTFTSLRRDPALNARVTRPLLIAEQAFRQRQDRSRLAQVLSLRATTAFFQNDFSTAFDQAHQVLQMQPEGEHHWRGSSLMLLGVEELLAGHLGSAGQRTLEARRAYETDQSLPGFLAVELALGEIRTVQGELRQAEQHYHRLLRHYYQEKTNLFQQQLTTESGTPETFFIRLALEGQAHLAYERNELDTAEDLLCQARALGSPVEELHLLSSGTLLQARLLSARGQIIQAQEMLARLAAEARSPQFLRAVRLCLVRLQLSMGDLAAAENQLQVCRDGSALFRLREEEEVLLQARLWIAQEEGEKALALLQPWKSEAEMQGRTRSRLVILLLEALAHAAARRMPQAKERVLRVLKLAKREGYQRLFLDEGRPLETLLKTLVPEITEDAVASYAYSLLRAFAARHSAVDASDGRQPAQEEAMLKQLSPQEQRVLRLLAAGYSNPEIARKLVVSLNTVKTHVRTLYRKLQVNNRQAAGAMARRLHLL
jgi:LuxR family maltose regulon positive regulatory protein